MAEWVPSVKGMRLLASVALLLVHTACGRVDQEVDDGPEDADYPTNSGTPSTVTETANPTTSESAQ